ncbi:MAG: SIS domain-containing protein [Myxococcales bacterium]|nr:SIS domain-containing protein [Myxococcales bacterium]
MSREPDGFAAFAAGYRERYLDAFARWDIAALAPIAAMLRSARLRGARVLIAGNGGSAAIANHAECDGSKTADRPDQPALDVRSLSANPSMLTAIANDLGYAAVFERQVAYFGRPGDVLILVSSGGRSPNMIEACHAARSRGLVVVAFVGFDGGELKQLADHVFHVPVDDYGIVEDLHQASFHVLARFLRDH